LRLAARALVPALTLGVSSAGCLPDFQPITCIGPLCITPPTPDAGPADSGPIIEPTPPFEIVPATAVVAVGAPLTLGVIPTGTQNVVFNVVSGPGTVDANGVFLAPSAGTAMIAAQAGTSSATAEIQVVAPGLYVAIGAPGGAGSIDGAPATLAHLGDVRGVGTTADGRVLLVEADYTLRLYDPMRDELRTLPRAPVVDHSTTLLNGYGIAGVCSTTASTAYVADPRSSVVYRIDVDTASVAVLAGTLGRQGALNGSPGRFAVPIGLACVSGGPILVAQQSGALRQIDPLYGSVSTLLSMLPGGLVAQLGGIAADAAAAPTRLIAANVASTGGLGELIAFDLTTLPPSAAAHAMTGLRHPTAVAVAAGKAYIADASLREILSASVDDLDNYTLFARLPQRTAADPSLPEPLTLALMPDGSALYVGDPVVHVLWRLEIPSGAISAVAGHPDLTHTPGVEPCPTDGSSAPFSAPLGGLAGDGAGALYFTVSSSACRVDPAENPARSANVFRVNAFDNHSSRCESTTCLPTLQFHSPRGMAGTAQAGASVYWADVDSIVERPLPTAVCPNTGCISIASALPFGQPNGTIEAIAVGPQLKVATTTTGTAAAGLFAVNEAGYQPLGMLDCTPGPPECPQCPAQRLAVIGQDVLWSDPNHHVVRRLRLGATGPEVVAGSLDQPGADATHFDCPASLAYDPGTQPPRLYVADRGNHAIRYVEIALSGGTASATIAFVLGDAGRGGIGVLAGSLGRTGTARLNAPQAIALLYGGDLAIYDAAENTIAIARGISVTAGW
jgi:hypothetical protein